LLKETDLPDFKGCHFVEDLEGNLQKGYLKHEDCQQLILITECELCGGDGQYPWASAPDKVCPGTEENKCIDGSIHTYPLPTNEIIDSLNMERPDKFDPKHLTGTGLNDIYYQKLNKFEAAQQYLEEQALKQAAEGDMQPIGPIQPQEEEDPPGRVHHSLSSWSAQPKEEGVKESSIIKEIVENTPLETKIRVDIEMSMIKMLTDAGYREDKAWTDDEDPQLSALSKCAKECAEWVMEEVEKHILSNPPNTSEVSDDIQSFMKWADANKYYYSGYHKPTGVIWLKHLETKVNRPFPEIYEEWMHDHNTTKE